tara:strand:- start:119 stop:322 length:204 start_codon:yes stop_codon:yes gene_type:complete
MPYSFSRKRPAYKLFKNTCGKDNCKCEYEDKNKSMETVIKKGNKILNKTVKVPKKKTLKEMFVIKKY